MITLGSERVNMFRLEKLGREGVVGVESYDCNCFLKRHSVCAQTSETSAMALVRTCCVMRRVPPEMAARQGSAAARDRYDLSCV